MVVPNIHFNISLSGTQLDRYLAEGWYRIGPFIFTTNFLEHPEGSWRVYWLRYPTATFRASGKQKKMLNAISAFTIAIRPLIITDELEQLYTAYRENLDFYTSPSLQRLLYDEIDPRFIPSRLFNSQLVEIRDNDKLIAAGVLDLGQNSSAGIVNFYDPAYGRYSLGKCLMLIKMAYTESLGMDYYYPGYIALDNPKFDYKLFLGANIAEIYDPLTEKWFPYSRDLMEELRYQFPRHEAGFPKTTVNEDPFTEDLI